MAGVVTKRIRTEIVADCYVCGGESWLPSLPEGESTCPYCRDGKAVIVSWTVEKGKGAS